MFGRFDTVKQIQRGPDYRLGGYFPKAIVV
jgi:hypothetical protein